MRPRTVAFTTLGCRLNQVDTQQLQTLLEARGYRTVPVEEPADVVVVNTCTVTARAVFSDRQAIRRAARVSPAARVVVTGCWAQTSPGEVLRLPEVALVVGNADKHRLPDLLDDLLTPRVQVSDIRGAPTLDVAPLARVPGRSRAFLKVQDGCQHRCAFCIVPLARGPKIVLTGVDLGHFGADLLPRATLAALLRELVGLPGLRWVRLSSVLPAYFTPELLELVTTARGIAPHFHVPLQSGSDRVLRLMRRPYNTRMYRDLVERLARALPALGLGADVIVGFPGEREADFEATLGLVEALPFSYVHVFPYSSREGTEAARLGDRVDAPTLARRSRVLRDLARRKNFEFRRRLTGGIEEVLVLETRARATGRLVGLSGNYVEVQFDGADGLMGRLIRVRVIGVERDRTLGEVA
ncbi:MAG: tRNA (N(6)-L-threonylcarbamoyladenosine(37)-C(2))-methylthiotransferase MtaB [Candidatus Rokuibacteriota bacterium]|nr:MAG: tRNA (N(6)-L-threonylcarbamoyladenosine(37)-C(2))-methylthiotransferase MtaB [Candidatus Rokubacteria bacterium]